MIAPGSIIGIIGGGQLGRMTATAAARLGYKVHIFTPEHDSPASHVAYATTVAAYDDYNALIEFADSVDVITFEFENIPHQSLAVLESRKPVHPGAKVLEVCRNRVREKTFVNKQGIGTAAFRRVTSLHELNDSIEIIGLPAVLKTSEMGYDGKGQKTIKRPADAEAAWNALKTYEAILEAFVPFRMEISVIVARSGKGEMKCYVPVQNIHKHHILDTTTAPAAISTALAKKAQAMAMKIARAIKLQGLLAVEMFVTKDNRILVNELAPRPHNSGHWTMDAAATSQFEQLVRAICGLPLGSPAPLGKSMMKNLIGEDVKGAAKYLKDKHARLHLYGKAETRPGRKMGHVTFLKG